MTNGERLYPVLTRTLDFIEDEERQRLTKENAELKKREAVVRELVRAAKRATVVMSIFAEPALIAERRVALTRAIEPFEEEP